MISQVSNAASLAVAWPQVEPMIDAALEHGEGDIVESDDILRAVVHGNSTMYVVHDADHRVQAVMVLSLHQGKILKVVVDVLSGDKWDMWIDELEAVLVDVSRKVNAQCIDASCRLGLGKRLERRGWRKKAIIMSMKL